MPFNEQYAVIYLTANRRDVSFFELKLHRNYPRERNSGILQNCLKAVLSLILFKYRDKITVVTLWSWPSQARRRLGNSAVTSKMEGVTRSVVASC